jgi:hypothetical protein
MKRLLGLVAIAGLVVFLIYKDHFGLLGNIVLIIIGVLGVISIFLKK